MEIFYKLSLSSFDLISHVLANMERSMSGSGDHTRRLNCIPMHTASTTAPLSAADESCNIDGGGSSSGVVTQAAPTSSISVKPTTSTTKNRLRIMFTGFSDHSKAFKALRAQAKRLNIDVVECRNKVSP